MLRNVILLLLAATAFQTVATGAERRSPRPTGSKSPTIERASTPHTPPLHKRSLPFRFSCRYVSDLETYPSLCEFESQVDLGPGLHGRHLLKERLCGPITPDDRCLVLVEQWTFELNTVGGFLGWGGLDFELRDGVLTLRSPGPGGGLFSRKLLPGELQELYTAAAAVDWEGLESSYIRPENPSCCCDQVIYDLSGSFEWCDRGEVVTTTWCDESKELDLIPPSLAAFLHTLLHIGCFGDECWSVTPWHVQLDSSGGFIGHGSRDYDLRNGRMSVRDPFPPGADPCRRELSHSEMRLLNQMAAAVDWEGMEDSYAHPENPDCCCDQLFYNLIRCDENVSVATTWCRDSEFEELLPMELMEFVETLRQVGDWVAEGCEEP